MAFDYYARLSPIERRIVRKSDQIAEVPLEPAWKRACAPHVDALDAALMADDRKAAQKAAAALVHTLCIVLRVPAVDVKVRAKRPRSHSSELHGLYTWGGGGPPTIEVWMRTAAHKRVVRFRTFVRTLLHEVCHHLDLTLFRLPETFHTEGFFRRESSLVRQLLGGRETKKRASTKEHEVAVDTAKPAKSGPVRKARRARAAPVEPAQLALF